MDKEKNLSPSKVLPLIPDGKPCPGPSLACHWPDWATWLGLAAREAGKWRCLTFSLSSRGGRWLRGLWCPLHCLSGALGFLSPLFVYLSRLFHFRLALFLQTQWKKWPHQLGTASIPHLHTTNDLCGDPVPYFQYQGWRCWLAQLGLEAKPDWSGLGRLSTAQPTSCGQESSISEGKPDWGRGAVCILRERGMWLRWYPKNHLVQGVKKGNHHRGLQSWYDKINMSLERPKIRWSHRDITFDFCKFK